MIKLFFTVIAGLIWITLTMVGNILIKPFDKAIENKNYILVALIYAVMIPFIVLNAIVTPFLEHE